jgi:hypothetical protein
MSDKDKEKIKKNLEENVKLKLKMKELVDSIKLLEEDHLASMDKFKKFI